MPKLGWSDADEIGFALSEAHPAVDPLTVRFTDLHRLVTQLPDFADDPAASDERVWKPSRWPGWGTTRRPGD